MKLARLTAVIPLFVLALLSTPFTSPTGREAPVLLVRIQNEPITPVTARFVSRALTDARNNGAQCLVIELDTPGGLMDSTQRIVTDILNSPIPVIVYVSPTGGRAASAGLFITLSSHIAAMSPGTRIGAAHPVQLGGLPTAPEKPSSVDDEEKDDEAVKISSAMEEKLVNDTVAWARSLAQLRNRNAEWAELAVTESQSLTATEAVEQNVVEFQASSLKDLLQQVDRHEVLVSRDGLPQQVTLKTAAAQVEVLEMWWGEKLLMVLANPNLTLLLMMFGVYGILYELYSPGWGVAGTLGVVSLVLAFFGLSVLPINYAGLALIGVAIALLFAEVFVTSYGSLAIAGIACLILGSTMLVDSPGGFLKVSLSLVVPLAIATGLIVVFLVAGVVRAQRGRVQTGSEGLMGMSATARNKFSSVADEYTGQVSIHGEIWNARCTQPVSEGDELIVKDRDGLTLLVSTRPKPDAAEPSFIRQQP